MGAQYGQQSTLSANDNNLRINIEDTLGKYPDWQFPLLKRWSAANFKADVRSHKYEWTERDLRPVKALVDSATVASDGTVFDVDTPGVFNVDDVLQKPDGEQVIVIAVAGGVHLTVQAWAGTPETMVAGDTVKRVGVASRQGALADSMVITAPEDLYNYTQIFEDVVEMSDTQHKALIRGDENAAQLIERKQKELMETLQSTLLVGRRNKNVGDKRYSMGGLKYMIDTYAPDNAIDFGGASVWNTDSSVKDKFDDAIEKIADKMGGKPTIYVGFKAMRKIAKLDDEFIRTNRTDKARGTAMPETYISQLGDLDIVQIRERTGVLDDLIFFVDEESVGYKPMKGRGWFSEEKPFAGDGHLWQVVGEYTEKVDTPKVHAYLYNLGL